MHKNAVASDRLLSPQFAELDGERGDGLDNGKTLDGAVGSLNDAPRVVALDEFLQYEFPARENILDPILPRQGLGMIHAWRGLGKTYLSLAMALAAVAGKPLLRWQTTRSWKVLYVDGEMPGPILQERIAALCKPMSASIEPSLFRLITPDIQSGGIPDLGTFEGQRWLDSVVDDADLIFLDNLSALVRTGSENADELWLPMASWLLRHRAAGRAVQLVHHDGKGEKQRGISRREDLLDTVLQLRKPPNYKESEGARFIVTYEKHRGFYGADAEPFEAKLMESPGGGLEWTMTEPKDARTVQVAELLAEGRTTREISEALNIGTGTVDRHKKKAVARGLLDE